METVFAIGDIHGEKNMLVSMLKHWNPDNEQLVLLGDLIDRGEESYQTLHLGRSLKEEYGAVVLSGNHEQLFLSWLDSPSTETELYFGNGGRETIHSFFDKKVTFQYFPYHLANLIKEQFPNEIQFMKDMPDYHEWNEYVFVHAGVNLAYENWKNSRQADFQWIREAFHYGKNDTGKNFVFGHTPTMYLNKNKSTDIWISPCKTKIGIDGGAVFGGLLHGLKIDKEGNRVAVSISKTSEDYISTLIV